MPSTRQLKIGLSNADKTNMANSVASSTLNTIINGEITVGSETTNLSEKISDINEAVASVADKAEVDGNYPSLTAGYSENLTPYGANSGVLDDTPFVFQTSGGESDIGAFAQIKNLKGKSVGWNQLVNFGTTTNPVTVRSDNLGFTLNSDVSSDSYFNPNITYIQGHKYLIKPIISGTFTVLDLWMNNSYTQRAYLIADGVQILTASGSGKGTLTYRGSSGASIILNVFDLTLIYGAGNEPTTVEEFEADFPLAYYAYDAGSNVSTKPKAYKIVGYNAFDGFMEQGDINNSGQEGMSSSSIRSKNYIKVIAGQTYKFDWENITFSNGLYLVEYDANKTFIQRNWLTSSQATPQNAYRQLTSNTQYVRFVFSVSSGSLSPVGHKICFHLKWDGSKTGYEEYYDETYQLPNIKLRSAGTAYDELSPDGTLIRRVGSVDLGSLGWDWDSGKNAFVCYGLPNPLKISENLLCAKYKTRGAWAYAALNDKEISTRGNYPYIYIRDDSFNGDTAAFKTAMSGVMLYYELATPTIEQSDDYKFVENTMIDDFGTQEILSDEDIIIAQPIEIFYSVDYKAFVDSLGGREDIEYKASNVVSKNDMEEYACSKDGDYENVRVGNLITDQNWRWVNDFQFGTGTVDTVFNGEATLYAIRGRSVYAYLPNDTYDWVHVNVVSSKSIIFNLYNPTLGYAKVVESDDENNGLCVYGTDITTSTILRWIPESSDPTNESDWTNDGVDISLTEETSSTGELYLHCEVSNAGYLRIKSGTTPEDFCIANVWGGNRVTHHPEYEEDGCTINSATFFPTGMKSINIGGEDVVYDELYANKYYARVLSYDFGATPSVSYVAASGTYNIYRMSLSNAMNKGACQIGGSTKFTWLDVGQMSSSTLLNVNSMSLASGYIYFAISKSEDTTYTYSEDSEVVDAESFATQSALHTLYTKSGDVYTEATEYTSETTYYYVSATNTHGLNGAAIISEITNKTILYQRYSMNKLTYTGTAISPALDWSYKMGDFGTEELILASGFGVTPYWIVYYPINALETIQQLPNNYVSLESAEAMLHQVGDLQGFDFDSISVDEETGNMKVNGLIDTKETIVISNSNFPVIYGSRTTSVYTPTNEVYNMLQSVAKKVANLYGNSVASKVNALKYFQNSPMIFVVDNDRGGIACFVPMSISTYAAYHLFYQGVYGHCNDNGQSGWVCLQTLVYRVDRNELRCIVNRQ